MDEAEEVEEVPVIDDQQHAALVITTGSSLTTTAEPRYQIALEGLEFLTPIPSDPATEVTIEGINSSHVDGEANEYKRWLLVHADDLVQAVLGGDVRFLRTLLAFERASFAYEKPCCSSCNLSLKAKYYSTATSPEVRGPPATLLFLAVASGHLGVVRVLVGEFGADAERVDRYGDSSLQGPGIISRIFLLRGILSFLMLWLLLMWIC